MRLYKYKNLSATNVELECKEVYLHNYIEDKNGKQVIVRTPAGERVIFARKDFRHVFTYKNKNTGNREFSFQRGRRVLWIKEVVTGNYHHLREDIGKEVYFYCPNLKYLIYCKKTSRGDLKFITHYLAKNQRKQKWLKTAFGIK